MAVDAFSRRQNRIERVHGIVCVSVDAYQRKPLSFANRLDIHGNMIFTRGYPMFTGVAPHLLRHGWTLHKRFLLGYVVCPENFRHADAAGIVVFIPDAAVKNVLREYCNAILIGKACLQDSFNLRLSVELHKLRELAAPFLNPAGGDLADLRKRERG